MQTTAKFTRAFPLYIIVPLSDKPYHENGTPLAFAYYTVGGTPSYYFYETNLQGDIVAIYDANGSKVVSFVYDAWGNFTVNAVNSTVCTAEFLAASLFRYRGYIYDSEIELYYLQSRYYDPDIGRFINADGVSYLGSDGAPISYNLYVYCGNNPVMGYDPTGYVNWWGVAAAVTLVVAGIAVMALSAGMGTAAGVAMVSYAGLFIASSGVVVADCAFQESAMVVDVSVTNVGNEKMGSSLVIDFEKNTFDLYSHIGVTTSYGSSSPLTISVGQVHNYQEIGDYGGEFINVGANFNSLGGDYCRAPNLDPDAVSATSITFGFPTSGFSCYAGSDYYYHVKSWGAE